MRFDHNQHKINQIFRWMKASQFKCLDAFLVSIEHRKKKITATKTIDY